jgi:hypothetical protein
MRIGFSGYWHCCNTTATSGYLFPLSNLFIMKYFLLPIMAGIILSACDRNTEIPNEEELITTLIYTLEASDSTGTATFSFRDIDGDGGQAPVILVDTLNAGTVYTGMITLLDESVSPAENITTEIEAEAEAHLFYFTGSSVSDNPMTISDTDDNGFPVGLATVLHAGSAGNSVLRITLRHMPDKSQPLSTAGGETDIEVEFPIVVE